MSGFDLSAVTGVAQLSVWVDFVGGSRVKVRYLTRDRMSEITRKATTVRFDPKSHQKIEDVDWDKWHEEVGLAAVEDWEDFVEGPSAYPCTPENIKTLVAKWFEFRKFVGDVCVDLEALVAAQKELERKNSATGSSPEKTTQD